MENTKIGDIPDLVSSTRAAFASGKTKNLDFRRKQLMGLHRLVTKEFDTLAKAIKLDLNKNHVEFEVMETNMISSDIAHALESLSKWTSTQHPSVDLVNAFDGVQLRPEPLGLVLIIGAWNYPIQLTLLPLVGAIAAGNCAIIKPSEISSNTAQALSDLLPKYLDKTCYKIVNGGVQETTVLLEQRFDHILYTGNGTVAKIVLAAATKFLTPVTLELGGKSPTIVLDDADARVAARRIMWGKFTNAGQTCIAPDYVLCSKEMQAKLIPEFNNALKEYFGEQPKSSDSYARIVNKNHFNRVSKMIESDKVAIGGQLDQENLFISPTILTNVTPDSPSMKDEIFGPVLPILNIESPEKAIEFVNSREKPLALYVHGKDKKVLNKIIDSTSAGGVVANDSLMHAAIPALPFGGVGQSGVGAYHGKHSFDLYTHFKPVVFKDQALEAVNGVRYPPYTEQKRGILRFLLLKTPKDSNINLPLIGLGVATLAAAAFYFV